MRFIEQIAKSLGIQYHEHDILMTKRLCQISNKLPQEAVPTHPAWNTFVNAAQDEVDNEGIKAIRAFVNFALEVTTPKERVYKIKRSPKGARIKIKSVSGKSFSFGPIWIESIQAGKGIALSKQNREKLEMHAQHVGLFNVGQFSSRELAQQISEKL